LAVRGVGGAQPNGYTDPAGISADGRYVLFGSNATNLTNGTDPGGLYFHDRAAGTNVYLGNNDGRMADNGEYVILDTMDALVPEDTDGWEDVYRWERATGSYTLISFSATISAYGVLDVSSDGRFVLFSTPASDLVPSDTNDAWDVFLYDVVNATTERVNLADDESQATVATDIGGDWHQEGAVSDDGRYVVFSSRANNLRPDDNDDDPDLFFRDRLAGTTTPISLNASLGWTRLGGVSSDGKTVAFIGHYLTAMVWHHGGVATPVPRATDGTNVGDGEARMIGMSADGRYVATRGHTVSPGGGDGYWLELYDRTAGVSEPFAVGPACAQVGELESPLDIYPTNSKQVLCASSSAFVDSAEPTHDWLSVLWSA
jgi:hypothetical protein